MIKKCRLTNKIRYIENTIKALSDRRWKKKNPPDSKAVTRLENKPFTASKAGWFFYLMDAELTYVFTFG